MIHELKTIQPFFDDVRHGEKQFEIRKGDRSFEVGDYLLLKEWNGEAFTGRELLAEVTYLVSLAPMLPEYVGMGFVIPPSRKGKA